MIRIDWTGLTDEIPFWNLIAKVEGTKVHAKAESYLSRRFGGKCEVEIDGAGIKPGTDGRADYINGNEIYEIKPITQHMKQNGKVQLQNYVDNYLEVPDAKKGTSLLSEINGKSIGEITYNFPGICTYTKSYRLITFDTADQAGMIYYAEQKRVDFSQAKESAKEISKAAGKAVSEIALLAGLILGSLVFN